MIIWNLRHLNEKGLKQTICMKVYKKLRSSRHKYERAEPLLNYFRKQTHLNAQQYRLTTLSRAGRIFQNEIQLSLKKTKSNFEKEKQNVGMTGCKNLKGSASGIRDVVDADSNLLSKIYQEDAQRRGCCSSKAHLYAWTSLPSPSLASI